MIDAEWPYVRMANRQIVPWIVTLSPHVQNFRTCKLQLTTPRIQTPTIRNPEETCGEVNEPLCER
jgi:hypothetical protein